LSYKDENFAPASAGRPIIKEKACSVNRWDKDVSPGGNPRLIEHFFAFPPYLHNLLECLLTKARLGRYVVLHRKHILIKHQARNEKREEEQNQKAQKGMLSHPSQNSGQGSNNAV